MSIYNRLAQHDSTLATEQTPHGENLVHLAATAPLIFSQLFIDQYLTLITSHGADMTARMTATYKRGHTPLHEAARAGSDCVAHWLCRQLTADDINRGRPNQPNLTPLTIAVEELHATPLDIHLQREHADWEGHSRRIRQFKTVIRVLRGGAGRPSPSPACPPPPRGSAVLAD